MVDSDVSLVLNKSSFKKKQETILELPEEPMLLWSNILTDAFASSNL